MRHNKIFLFLLPVMSFSVVLFASLLIHAQEPPDDYLVIFGEGISVVDREIAVRNAGASPRFNYYVVPGAAVHIPNVRALEALQRDPRVVAIIPDRKVYAHVIEAGNVKGGVKTTGQVIPSGVKRIGASPDNGSGTGYGVGVAVVDTGLDFNHNDLKPTGDACFTAFSSCQDDNGHGTHVTGIIAARNNTIDVVGVAPDSIPYAVKVLDQSGNGSDATVISGLDWIYQSANSVTPPIRVVNMSLGRPGTIDDDILLRQAIQKIVTELGISVVVSAGNDSGLEVSQQVPATYPEVMAIASTAAEDGANKCNFFSGYIKTDTASFFTTDGRLDSVNKIGVTVSAPGETRENISGGCMAQSVGILSTKLGGGTTRMSGTSMAAPHVSGVVARILEINGQMLPEDIRTQIRSNASRITLAPLDSPTKGYTFDGEREGIAVVP